MFGTIHVLGYACIYIIIFFNITSLLSVPYAMYSGDFSDCMVDDLPDLVDSLEDVAMNDACSPADNKLSWQYMTTDPQGPWSRYPETTLEIEPSLDAFYEDNPADATFDPKYPVTEAVEDPEADELLTLQDAQLAAQRHGEWVYELFAVLIHSGAIHGGHYYAYIKDLESGRWLDFNDSNVTEIEESKVRETWGGATWCSGGGYGMGYTTSYQSSANAYMLQYRKIATPSVLETGSAVSDRSLVSFPGKELIPAYISEAVEKQEEEKKAKELAAFERFNQVVLKVYWREVLHTIKTSKKELLGSFMIALCKELKLTVPVLASPHGEDSQALGTSEVDMTDLEYEKMICTHLRLRGLKMNSQQVDFISRRRTYASCHQHSTLIVTLSPQTQEVYSFTDNGRSTLQENGIYDGKSFLLEAKQSEGIWEPFCKDDCDVNCYEYDETTLEFKEPRSIRVPKGISVADMRAKIQQWVDYDLSEILMLKLVSSHGDVQVEEILHDTLKLKDYLNFYYSAPSYELFWERRPAAGVLYLRDCKSRQVGGRSTPAAPCSLTYTLKTATTKVFL